MSDAFEFAKQSFIAGIQHFEAGRFTQAEAAFEIALKLVPGRPSVLMNLGVTKVHLGHYAAAEPLLQAALAGDDNQPDAWKALGIAQMETGQFGPAIQTLNTALELVPGDAPLHVRLAQCQARAGTYATAIDTYRKALALEPNLVDAWTELGHVLRESGRLDEAATCFREALARGGDAAMLNYALAALQPAGDAPLPEAPRAYVEALFDEYAEDFDEHLVKQLGYRGHNLLIERLPASCPARFERVLDAGCGTGLIGPLIRPRADFLAGMDLSGAMVEKARQRGLYDALDQADLLDYLRAPQAPWDLVLVADVFVYIGALDAVFELLAQRLAPQGWLAFTIEETRSDQDVELLPSLRYAHAPAYLRRLAAAHGLRWVDAQRQALRYDQRQGIHGLCVFLQKA